MMCVLKIFGLLFLFSYISGIIGDFFLGGGNLSSPPGEKQRFPLFFLPSFVSTAVILLPVSCKIPFKYRYVFL